MLLIAALPLLPRTVGDTLLRDDAGPLFSGPDWTGTTSGLASGRATPDGRPLVWKSRDRRDLDDIEYHYRMDRGIPFTSVTDNGETDEYYGGVNAAGFIIENTDAHNLPHDNPLSNGWGGDYDDGEMMDLALGTCRTVDDFQALLDSLNTGGRTYNFNYGVVDAYGGAALFEAAGYSYTRFDVADEPDGFLIRSNYSYTGANPSGDDALYGLNRHDTAYRLFKKAADDGRLTPEYILRNVARNLSLRDLQLDSLPFAGYYEGYPYGVVPNETVVCRAYTRAVYVAQGVREGGNPDDALLWAMAGSPLGAVATPLWVRAGSVPAEYDSPAGSRLCRRMIELRDWTYSYGAFGAGVDTWRLRNPQGTGLWDFNLQLEDWMFQKTLRFLSSPDFDYDRLEAFQNALASQVADSLDAWQPGTPVTETLEAVFDDGQVTLAWGELREDGLGRAAIPSRYQVFGSDQPFRAGEGGELIAEVTEPRWTDRQVSGGMRFYRVEVEF